MKTYTKKNKGIIEFNKKGSYTLEASIFLPICIIAILTIGYFIKIIGAGEMVMHIGTDEGRLQAQQAYVDKLALGFTTSIEKRVLEECKDIDYVEVKNFRYLYSRENIKGLISFDIKYFVGIKLPLKLYDGAERKEKVLARAWIGVDSFDEPFGFAEMENASNSKTVWLFPKAGEKYHKEACTYVSNFPQEFLLNENIKKLYSSCESCRPDELGNGSLIYCFTSYGKAYHQRSCNSVTKYTISMEKEDAELRGYTACSKCGGM